MRRGTSWLPNTHIECPMSYLSATLQGNPRLMCYVRVTKVMVPKIKFGIFRGNQHIWRCDVRRTASSPYIWLCFTPTPIELKIKDKELQKL
jgi:hypothetical protein